MPGGRPAKPTALKILQGNPGHRPISSDEPIPLTGPVKPPSWLSTCARRLWKQLAPLLSEMRVLTPADIQALALLCAAADEYLQCSAVVRREGRTYTTMTRTGELMYRPRPEVAMASDAWRRVQRMLSEFGLTPSSRSKVHAATDAEADPFEEFIRGRSRAT